jgi:hypothetical protein
MKIRVYLILKDYKEFLVQKFEKLTLSRFCFKQLSDKSWQVGRKYWYVSGYQSYNKKEENCYNNI